jgi:hypothetical protein
MGKDEAPTKSPRGSRLIGSSRTPSLTIPYGSLGIPGARCTMHIVPQFLPPRSVDDEVLVDASPRTFVVSGRLAKAPMPPGDIKGDFTEKDGGSYLLAPTNFSEMELGTPWGRCRVKKNDAGELSFAEFECEARHPMEARAMFIEAMFPALDH